jgi:hypothetical protein
MATHQLENHWLFKEQLNLWSMFSMQRSTALNASAHVFFMNLSLSSWAVQNDVTMPMTLPGISSNYMMADQYA